MFKIRGEQMDRFSELAHRRFEDKLVAHLRRFFPETCESLGEEALRGLIAYGVRRAADHGFCAERDVSRYIDIMTVFGRDFDRDEAHPWARAILDDPALPEPGWRMSRLCKKALEHEPRRAKA